MRFVSLTSRGLLALPADIRRRAGLDKPGAQVAVVERRDGVIELHPTVPVPADQTWFWTERWQQMEADVDRHVLAGDIARHESSAEFLAHLDQLTGGA